MERGRIKQLLEGMMNRFCKKSDELSKIADMSPDDMTARLNLTLADNEAAKLFAVKEIALRMGFAVVYDALKGEWELT